MVERRMGCKILAIMDNPNHPSHPHPNGAKMQLEQVAHIAIRGPLSQQPSDCSITYYRAGTFHQGSCDPTSQYNKDSQYNFFYCIQPTFYHAKFTFLTFYRFYILIYFLIYYVSLFCLLYCQMPFISLKGPIKYPSVYLYLSNYLIW